jgi:hypothetical protein
VLKLEAVRAFALDGGLTPELAYVTANSAGLAPFAKLADMLAEALPVGGGNAGTVCNRTRRVGERIARLGPDGAVDPDRRDRPRWRLSAQPASSS